MNQKVSGKHFSELLHNVYNNVIFSTLPYTLYKEEHSDKCIYVQQWKLYRLVTFRKRLFTYKLQILRVTILRLCSRLLQDSRNSSFTHCSVLIPFSNYEFYIIDAALYFLEPIYCNLKENIQRTIKCQMFITRYCNVIILFQDAMNVVLMSTTTKY